MMLPGHGGDQCAGCGALYPLGASVGRKVSGAFAGSPRRGRITSALGGPAKVHGGKCKAIHPSSHWVAVVARGLRRVPIYMAQFTV